MIIHSKININKRNQIEILNYLREEGAKSRVDIAHKMALTKASVTIITNDMIQKGILYEKGVQPQESNHTRGRRKILLEINENYKLAFGIVFEKNKLIIGLTNLKGQTLDKKIISIKDKTYRESLQIIVAEISSLIQYNHLANDKILGLGVCISNGGGDLIDGNTLFDKLNRLKKDLAHAISLKIVTQTTANAALIAQRLFGNQMTMRKNILMLRYGEPIEASVMINGNIYNSNTKSAGGFQTMQKINDKNTYLVYQQSIEKEENEDYSSITNELNMSLARDINTCQIVLDTEGIFAYGDYFEQGNRLNEINFILEGTYRQKVKLTPSVVTDATVYLAACSILIQYCFYLGGDS